MKTVLLSLTFAFLAYGSAHAASPCFHSGTYSGAGVGRDAAGKHYPYTVETTVRDSDKAVSTFKWDAQPPVNLDYRISGGQVFFNHSPNATGTIDCGMVTARITVDEKDLKLSEEWFFTGNYLLRSGHKSEKGIEIDYQELLIRR